MSTASWRASIELSHSFVRAPGAIGAAGGLLLWRSESMAPRPSAWSFTRAQTSGTRWRRSRFLMLVVGVIVLGRAGFAGQGPVSLIGLGAAVLGLGIVLLPHAIAAADASNPTATSSRSP